MVHVCYSPFAREDIESSATYIADRNSQAARRFLQAVQDTVKRIAEFPTLGVVYPHPDHPGLRAKLVTAFRNFIIFYAIRDERIYIVRVLHTARDIPHILNQ